MRCLVIGGTQFVGRHIVEAALAAGDEVTLFHRGRTNPDLFPDARHLTGDRNSDLSALAGEEWDATIDVSAYVPRQVAGLAEALSSSVGGPFDHTYRFTWWVERIARGGRVLAPGPGENPFQVIDARDLGAFVRHIAAGGATGTYHAVSPAPPFSFADFLDAVVEAVGPPGTELVWVDASALEAAGVTGQDLPLWAGEEEGRDLSAADPTRAVAAGLDPRPLGDTIRDVHAHEQATPTPAGSGVGLAAEREAELLAALA